MYNISLPLVQAHLSFLDLPYFLFHLNDPISEGHNATAHNCNTMNEALCHERELEAVA